MMVSWLDDCVKRHNNWRKLSSQWYDSIVIEIEKRKRKPRNRKKRVLKNGQWVRIKEQGE